MPITTILSEMSAMVWFVFFFLESWRIERIGPNQFGVAGALQLQCST